MIQTKMYWGEKEYAQQHKIKLREFIKSGLDEIDNDKNIKIKIRTLRTDGKWD